MNQPAPTVGRTVLYRSNATRNGADVHPAVVTRVWNETMVNLHVFFDASPSEPRTSITFFPTEDEATAFIQGRLEHNGPSAQYACCYFPSRV